MKLVNRYRPVAVCGDCVDISRKEPEAVSLGISIPIAEWSYDGLCLADDNCSSIVCGVSS